MTRHYFIIARDQTGLCDYLARQFASEENVEVFLDRRSGHERRVHGVNAATGVERRSADRRHQPFVDTQLRSLGYAMFRVA